MDYHFQLWFFDVYPKTQIYNFEYLKPHISRVNLYVDRQEIRMKKKTNFIPIENT